MKARLKSPPPSSVVSSASQFLKIQNEPKQRILNGRPLQNHGLPVELYHPVFDKFRTDANDMTLEITSDDYNDVTNLYAKAAEIYEIEADRDIGTKVLLQKLLGAKFETRFVKGPGTAHANEVITLEMEETVAFIAVMEMKNEIGSAKCDPATQASFSYAPYMTHVRLSIVLTTFV